MSPVPQTSPNKPRGTKSRTPLHQPRSLDRILRWREVSDRIGLSRATIWRMVRGEGFPAPVPLGLRSVGWLERDVAAWIAERAARRPSRKQTATT